MNYKEFLHLLTWLSPLTLILGAVIGLAKFKTLGIVTKSVTIYLVVMLLVDFGSRILHHIFPNNLFGFPVYCLIELCMFTYFYHKYFLSKRYKALLVLNFAGIACILFEIVTFSYTNVKDFQSYAKVFDNFGIILLALTYCYEQLDKPKEGNRRNFALNMVVLIFFTINLLFFLPYNFIINNNGGIQFYFWAGILITTVAFYIYLTNFIRKDAKTNKIVKA